MLKSPPFQSVLKWLGKKLGSNTADLVKVRDEYMKIRGYLITYHDLHHLEVSYLDRIKIGKHMVSGIHGINSAMFHDLPIIEEYHGNLDEIRVVFHQWVSRPSLLTTFKLIFWMFWIMLSGINPIAVLCRHIKTMNHRENIYKLADKITFVNSNDLNYEDIKTSSFL